MIEKKVKKLSRPGKLAKYIVKAAFKKYISSGIFCTYYGYLTASDLNGQVIFPRKVKDPELNIIITNRIIPIAMGGNTLHHWEIDPGTPAKMYSFSRRFDREIGAHFWETKEIELPKDERIDKHTIVVIGKPKYFKIPLGVSITDKSTQLLLPDIYLQKNIIKAGGALYIFALKNFFQTIHFKFKKNKASYIQQISG